MIKINKNELSNLNVKDIRSLDNCEWVDDNNLEWYEGEGVYFNNCGSRGENEIVKVDVDKNGFFEVESIDEMKKMGCCEDFVESEFGEVLNNDNNKLNLKVIYIISYGEESYGDYFYFRKEV